MDSIVCATRGGAGSRAVQQAAITYARESSSELIFLFVIDTSGLDGEEEKLISSVHNELHWFGQTLLHIAKKRAATDQVSAEIVIRDGEVQDEIGKFLTERSADLLLLGAPRGTTAVTYGDDVLEKFADSIRRDTGVRVEIIRPH
jgi:nucleotide-binding universal stress UspA family protein